MYARLKKNSQFNLLFSKGKKAFSPALILLYLPSDKLEIGICVSKKHGNAVMRNRIKRLMREALQKNIEKIRRPYSMVFIAKQAEKYALASFLKSVELVLKREGLI